MSEVVISPVAKGLTLIRAAPAPPESALRAQLYLKIPILLGQRLPEEPKAVGY